MVSEEAASHIERGEERMSELKAREPLVGGPPSTLYLSRKNPKSHPTPIYQVSLSNDNTGFLVATTLDHTMSSPAPFAIGTSTSVAASSNVDMSLGEILC
jgi:hypothetical protein